MRSWSSLMLSLFLVSCASNSKLGEPVNSTHEEIGWPKDSPRIRYLYSFNGPAELGYSASFTRRLKGWLGGEEVQEMISPYAVAVSEELIAVTDTALGIVHVFNKRKNHYKQLVLPGNQNMLSPVGISLGDDRIFVADSSSAKIYIFDIDAKLVGEVSGFLRPTGLAFDRQAKLLYVADTLAHEVLVYDQNGRPVRRIGTRGGATGQFNFPTHLAISPGRLFVNDSMNFRIQVFTLNGDYINSLGQQGDSAGYLSQPKGIDLNSEKHLFVVESVSGNVQIFDLDGIFLMSFGNARGTPAALDFPAGLAIFADRIFVADSGNGRIQVFEYLPGD